jgi:hypothetical protein
MSRRVFPAVCCLFWFFLSAPGARPEAEPMPPAKPLVGAYYFIWYDTTSGFHIKNPDGSDALMDHPPTLKDFSYTSVAWHETQLRDMQAAKLDFLLPVYWGAPDGSNAWSDIGVKTLVRAWKKLVAAGEKPPKIGMFYDTTTLQFNQSHRHIDLSIEAGKLWFYDTIRRFYLMVPSQARFTVDGRPVIWLYSAGFAARPDPAIFAYVREKFSEDFGVLPFIVKEISWPGPADLDYQWGGALTLRLNGAAALGPGYDDRAVPGRNHIIVARKAGDRYRQAWEKLLALDVAQRPKIAVVETWNEFHEGTDIADSKEYGRQYIDLTARYAKRFKRGDQLKPGKDQK